jgi:hypothetical protein
MLYAFRMRCVSVAWLLMGISVFGSSGELSLLRVLELKGRTHHVQGIDSNAQRLWVTSVDTPNRKGFLHQFSLTTGDLERAIEIQDGDRFHPGGIAADMTSLWIPVAEYRANSTSTIQRRSKRTLKLESQFSVSDHIGCVAFTPEFLIGANWDSREFYVWTHEGNLIRKLANTTANAYQDMKYDSGRLVASGLLPDHTGAIDWLEFPSMKLLRRIMPGKTDRGAVFTREGMSVRGNQLLLLPEDGPSRLFVFRLDR